MNIEIRNETEKDFHEVEELTREAFWNLYFPGCIEHYLVHQMRNHPDFIKELDFVAESNGKIVGNIMYTKASLINENGQELEIISFGPLSVLPEYQRKGIGSVLVSHTKNLARKKGIKGIVIFGDPHNYCKHGFKNGKDLNISDMNGEYPYGMLTLELEKGAFEGHKWKYKYSDAFNVNQEVAEKFDKKFGAKKRVINILKTFFQLLLDHFSNRFHLREITTGFVGRAHAYKHVRITPENERGELVAWSDSGSLRSFPAGSGNLCSMTRACAIGRSGGS